ncbi:MAG: hypothetical protein KGP01_05735 [Actinomycetales bacterium]|nr:hypothetical protein [Actinomycetales bacterium]
MDSASDETLDRLLRHMAWANQGVLAALADAPEESLALHANHEPEWTVHGIVRHFVRSAGFYAQRLGAEVDLLERDAAAPPENIESLAAAVTVYDAALRDQSHQPEAILPHTRPDGTTVTRARSTILAQAVHHATEHRAQIAGILSANGIRVIDLDEFDVWALGDAEGRGE